ncbi:hypothetical protein GXW82_44080 [Streptacidiphilus sp. 4-A2]|nr:hypothetical protein [Streptacidiphilus sp. 4-A2]
MPRRAPAPVDLPVIEPMLASPGSIPRDPTAWAFEVKFDGMRVGSYLDGAHGLRLLTRNGNPATDRFPELAELLELLPGRNAVLDGEIVAADDQGRPDFGRLQQRMTLRRPAEIRAAMARIPVTLLLFDVPWLDGRPLTELTYRGRREVLETLPLHGERVQVPPAWPGSAAQEASAWTRDHGLEGLIAKRLTSPYQPGARSRDWIKIKHVKSLDATIGAWVPGGPGGTMVKSLLLGVPAEQGLRFVGAVGTGFSQAERRALAALLRRLAAPTSPFEGPWRAGLERGEIIRFVRPRVQGEVEYAHFTAHGHLRHPVWKGLRGDYQE